MKIKYKTLIFTSKKYDLRIKNSFKKIIRTKIRKKNCSHKINKPKSPMARKQKYEILLEKSIIFPQSLKKISTFILELEEKIGLGHIMIRLNKLTQIDNLSILILTALIYKAFGNNKLKRNKKRIPREKNINSRLEAIGFWEALCFNPPKIKKYTEFLKVTRVPINESKNDFHLEIINFFSDKIALNESQKDALFDAVFEASANSIEHSRSVTDAWFLGFYDEENNQIELAFYDTGVGIFSSIDEMEEDRFKKMLLKIRGIFGKEKMLKLLCTTHLSKYKKDRISIKSGIRGNGMPSYIRSAKEISENHLTYIEVMTDNYLYSSYNNETKKIKYYLKGTLIRWVINISRGFNE
ncbi:hypothetical protein CQA57_04420 [Helicobacter anseris]|uniref:Uncharacterized protein n=1 Tax=Helicobacter anseris TaxID=375926 RepID=A0A3D8J9S1_9HELI|nr:hypothetical protein [Helicobacter anseris]RDU73915.1 hypothetical protein CQA57_04420 [Helicobacter anseris]